MATMEQTQELNPGDVVHRIKNPEVRMTVERVHRDRSRCLWFAQDEVGNWTHPRSAWIQNDRLKVVKDA